MDKKTARLWKIQWLVEFSLIVAIATLQNFGGIDSQQIVFFLAPQDNLHVSLNFTIYFY